MRGEQAHALLAGLVLVLGVSGVPFLLGFLIGRFA